jgi:hypothetical protein
MPARRSSSATRRPVSAASIPPITGSAAASAPNELSAPAMPYMPSARALSAHACGATAYTDDVGRERRGLGAACLALSAVGEPRRGDTRERSRRVVQRGGDRVAEGRRIRRARVPALAKRGCADVSMAVNARDTRVDVLSCASGIASVVLRVCSTATMLLSSARWASAVGPASAKPKKDNRSTAAIEVNCWKRMTRAAWRGD